MKSKKQYQMLAIFITTLLFGILTSCSTDTLFAAVVPPTSTIRVVLDNNYPPYIFPDEHGNPQGILVDQWALWEKQTGIKVELTPLPWEDALRGMQNGEFDVIDTIFYTEERSKVYDFTSAYARIDVPIFFHDNVSGISGVDDLMGFRVAVKTGDTNVEFLEAAGVKGLVYYNDYEEIIRAAAKREETIFIVDQPPGLYYLYKYGLQDQFNYSAPLFSGELHRAVKKGDIALLTLVEEGFASITEAEYKAIEDRWFGFHQNNEWQEYLSYGIGGVLFFFIIISGLSIFNHTLQQRVNQRVTELETLYESGLTINQIFDPREIGQKVIELLEQKLGWHHTTIRLYHPQDESLELLAFNQSGLKNEAERRKAEERFTSLIVHSTQGMSGWAVQNKRVIRSNDLRNDPHYVDTYPGLQSGLYVPMKLGDRVIGVISIESDQLNAFSNTDERLTATLANQAASALENARLFAAERRQREVSDALRDALSVGASMSASLDSETILDRLLEALARVVPFEGGTIMLVQAEQQKIRIARMRGYKKLDKTIIETIINSFDIGSAKNLRWMLENKQPLVIPNTDQYPGWIHTQETSFIRSWAGAPIIVNNAVVAFFSLDSSTPNFFTNDHVELMRAFTGQASLALQNARLFEETERRFKEFAALYEISNALSADNALNTLLKDIVEHAKALLGTATGAMYLRNRTNDNLEIVVSTTPAVSVGTILRPGEGMAGRVAQTRQPLRIENYSTWEGRLRRYDEVLFRADLEVPILFGGDLIGVLDVAEVGDSDRTFTEADERLLSLFAAQAAGVLHSARLREETSRRAQEFAALYETSNALSAENEPNSMLQSIVEHAKKLLGAASSSIYLYHAESNELILTVSTSDYLSLGVRLQTGEGAAGYVAQTRQSLRLDDYSTWEGRSSQYNDRIIHAILEVPMLYGGELIGVLTADEAGDSRRKFTEADERLLSLFASQAAGAIHSARLREQTERRLNQLQALHLIDRAISSSFDLRPILNTVIAQTIAQLNVDAVDILLFHPHLKTLDYVAGQGFRNRAIEQTHLRLGECFSGHAAFERRTIHVANLPENGANFTRASILQPEGFLEFYAVPLIAKGEIKGVLEVFHRTTLPTNPEWLDFLETLAGQAAITIDQTQLFDDLQRANLELIIAYDATIEGWARAMDLRDKETENHTQRVTELTLSLAGTLGVKGSELVHIRRGALLHDIGKIGIPDNILLKQGDLTEAEWQLMRRHPQFAYEMLQPIKYLRQSLDIPYCHHEKWDGSGYPRGLKGEQIPIAARIFSIVDVWDAITSDRPYRKALTNEESLAYIKEQSGKQFDPKIVAAFLRMIGS